MYVVDASVWVSRMVPSDRHHQSSQRWLRVARPERFIAPLILLPEIGGPIARITGRSDVAVRTVSVVQRLSYLILVPVGESFARFSADLAAEFRLRGADALYVALARRLDIPLVTWDQEQLDGGGQIVSARTPQEALQQ